jgi:hypothetical protein
MAARIKASDYTFSSTAAVQMSTILGEKASMSNVLVRANSSNVGNVNVGNSNVTSTTNIGGFLKKDEALSADLISKFLDSDTMYLQAAQNDRVHVLWIQ